MADAAVPDDGDDGPEGTTDIPQAPPEKFGLSFYAAIGLIVILVLMVVIINYPAERANAGATMAQTNWTLQTYRDATGIQVPAITGSGMTARFDSSAGKMSGSSGCNWYSATYTTKDYTINITPGPVTLMYCTGPGIMEQETAFLADLPKVTSFRVSESLLKFYDAAGKPVLVFVPA